MVLSNLYVHELMAPSLHVISAGVSTLSVSENNGNSVVVVVVFVLF